MTIKRRSQFPTLAEQHMNSCRHFNGILGPYNAAKGKFEEHPCEAGVEYASVRVTREPPEPGRAGYAFPCFRDDGVTDRCALVNFPTREEAEAEEQRANEYLREWSRKIAGDICPTCDKSITKRQVGRCVYGSCGHRLYQGTIR